MGVRGVAVGWGTVLRNQKVAGSIPDCFDGIFHWHNPSVHTVALRLTQALTEYQEYFLGIKEADCLEILFRSSSSSTSRRIVRNNWLNFILECILLTLPIQFNRLILANESKSNLTNGSISKSPNGCINSLLYRFLKFSFTLIPPNILFLNVSFQKQPAVKQHLCSLCKTLLRSVYCHRSYLCLIDFCFIRSEYCLGLY
jgi:hypothetical protein